MKRPAFLKQVMMVRVLYALLPVALAAIYLFGWRVLALVGVSALFAFLAEWIMVPTPPGKISQAVWVTAALYGLALPPTTPFWIAAVGAVFGIVFGKMVYGGFGRNVFNPALTGRAFIYVSFGNAMTAQWSEPFRPFPAGLLRWGWSAASAPPDALTSATPGPLLKLSEAALAERGIASLPSLWDLFSGICPGVIGGTSAALTILCGLYIVWKKAANFRIVVAGFLGFFAAQTLFWLLHIGSGTDPLRAAAAGSLVIGLFFYATDPVSASQTDPGRWIYGAFIGAMSSLIASFSAWPAGTMFAILLANMFAPIMDIGIKALQAARQRRAAP